MANSTKMVIWSRRLANQPRSTAIKLAMDFSYTGNSSHMNFTSASRDNLPETKFWRWNTSPSISDVHWIFESCRQYFNISISTLLARYLLFRIYLQDTDEMEIFTSRLKFDVNNFSWPFFFEKSFPRSSFPFLSVPDATIVDFVSEKAK